jgi:hypothetical protein
VAQEIEAHQAACGPWCRIEQPAERVLEAALGQAGHHENVVAERGERFVEGAKNMF